MDLSGLIFVALALVWAIVLIPMALKHHDEVAKTRSVDKFSDDMRVLARREAVNGRESRLVVGRHPTTAPLQQPAAPAAAGRARATKQRPARTTAHARSVAARRRAAKAAAGRRRLILGVLLLADVVVGVGVALGWFLTWAPAVLVSLTLLFLVVARCTVSREQKRWSKSVVARRAAASALAEPALAEPALVEPVETTPAAALAEPPLVEPPLVEPPLVEPPLVEPVETTPAAALVEQSLVEPPLVEPVETTPCVARNDQGLPVVSGLDDTSSVPVGPLGELEPTLDSGALWDPLPVTLPTYVTKPRASRSVRTIDLQASGVSSSGRDAGDSALVAEGATSRPETDEPRKAVGS